MPQFCTNNHTLVWTDYSNRTAHLYTNLNISCDGCGKSAIRSGTRHCRECDIDICENCFDHKPAGYRWARNTSLAVQPPGFQACCMLAILTTADPLTAAARGERYNGRRPTAGRRVSCDHFPDPTNYGWTFTGSCNGGRAEFFEKDFGQHGVVKLDFYYTTGTVKTVLDHPWQGVTQLFAKGSDLSPAMYRKILMNPREHTSVRYHTTGQRRNRNCNSY